MFSVFVSLLRVRSAKRKETVRTVRKEATVGESGRIRLSVSLLDDSYRKAECKLLVFRVLIRVLSST